MTTSACATLSAWGGCASTRRTAPARLKPRCAKWTVSKKIFDNCAKEWAGYTGFTDLLTLVNDTQSNYISTTALISPFESFQVQPPYYYWPMDSGSY